MQPEPSKHLMAGDTQMLENENEKVRNCQLENLASSLLFSLSILVFGGW